MKQVIVMRTDLGMRKGKMIAQGSHSSLAAILKYSVSLTTEEAFGVKARWHAILLNDELEEWLAGSFTKICVRCDSEEELLALYEQVEASDIVNHALITDAGRTEFNGVPTKTCFAVGPALPSEVDKITGHLKLL